VWRLTPKKKKPQVLTKQLAEFESQRGALAKTIAKLQGDLEEGQAHWNKLRYPGGRYSFVYPTVPNLEEPGVIAAIANIQKQIHADEVTLASRDAKIQSLKIQIPQAQHEYEASIAPLTGSYFSSHLET